MFVRQALKLASYRSYRDLRSRESLKSLSFTQTDDVYPDLAFSYLPSSNSPAFRPGQFREGLNFQPKSVVGISPIAYLSIHGWPVTNIPVYERYVRELATFMRKLIQQGHAIRLFATDSPDVLAINDLMEHFTEADAADRISRPAINTVEELINLLLTVDYVVASRLHGTILSHLTNRPVLAISYDTKVDVHMEQMGQSEYCVDIHTATAETLSQTFFSLVDNAVAVKQSLRKATHEYSALLARQYDSVLQRAGDGVRWPSVQTTTSDRRRGHCLTAADHASLDSAVKTSKE